MLSFLVVGFAFILGGLTFVPILLAALLGFLFYTSQLVPVTSSTKTGIPAVQVTSEEETEPVTLYRAGWLIVRRTYEPWLGSNDGTYVGMLASGYRSFMDNRSRDPRRTKPKERFYAVLKQNILFLFENEQQLDCWAAIEVSAHKLVIYPDGTGLDGELFVKRNAICLKPIQDDDNLLAQCYEGAEDKTHDLEPSAPLPWFLFAQVNSDKEDWLHSLEQASKMGRGMASAAALAKDQSLFDPDDMARLVEGIDQQPDSIPMRWFNALLGRIFLAVYRTSSLEEYIVSRIVRKLKRVKTPSMLSEIKVREVNVGSAAPLFSKPMLKELTTEGDASMEVHLSYIGDLRITIETVATINLGSRFKPYSVQLVLAVVLKELEGTMLFKIKRPPSNRLWFGFTAMPKMKLSVEPVVSTRQIKWSMITSPIESRLREVIMESIVVPHMDDIPFFNSQPFFTRGGIWGDALRKEPDLSEPAPADAPVVGQSENAEADPSLIETVPTVGGKKSAHDAITSATGDEESASTTRMRPRRRRSSEGDSSPLDMSALEKDGTLEKDGISSSSTSLSSFSLASWRETRSAAKETTASNPSTTPASDKRRTWFGNNRSYSVATADAASPPTSPVNTSKTNFPSRPRSGSSEQVPSIASTSHDSAARLREMLQARARSREREKTIVEQAVADVGLPSSTTPIKSPGVLVEAPSPPAKAPKPAPSGLSLTAPTSNSASGEGPPPLDSVATTGTLFSSLTEKKLSESPGASSVDLPKSTTSDATAPITSAAAIDITQEIIPVTVLSQPSTIAKTTHTRSVSCTSSRDSIIIHGSPVSRPSFAKPRPEPSTPPPLPLPPPRRTMDSNAVPPVSGTANSIISSWRTKASDKEAIAAGVAQAKDAMKRWGANWTARRKIDEDVSSPPQDDHQSLPSSMSDPTLGNVADDSYRDYRASKSTAVRGGEYFHPVSTAGSAPVAIVGDGSISVENGDGGRAKKNSLTSSPSKTHFTPAASSPTTKISAVATLAAGSPTEPLPRPLPTTTHKSPTSPPNAPARVYRPATMMAIPGIRDDAKRKAIAADHMAAPAPAPEAAATVVPPPSTSPNTAAVIGASEILSHAVPFGPPPSISDRSEKPGTIELEPLTATSTAARPTTPPPPLVADVTTLEMETTFFTKPKPSIPARPRTTEATSNEEESKPDPGTDDGSTQESGGLLPTASIEATSTPSITASRPAWIRNDKPNAEPTSHAQINTSSEAVAEDETTDEAGWGLEDPEDGESGRAQS